MIYLDGNIQSVLKFYVLPEQQKRKILMNKIKQRQVLKNNIRDIDCSLIDHSENSLFHNLLYGNDNINDSKNAHILNGTIEYILSRPNVSFRE